jgi:rhodanese-related sulfurtransferase
MDKEVKQITRQELLQKLERKDNFKLVMTLGEWAFRAKHIPGSLNISTPEQVEALLDPADEIVVYCTNVDCPASIAAYHMLRARGFANVRRYSGGLEEWEAAGLPLDGEWVES